MRQRLLPVYEPFYPAPERAVLTLLHAALNVTEQAMRDAIPLVGSTVGEPQPDPADAVLLCTAKLIVRRCIELREFVDLYDTLLDRLRYGGDDEIPF
jgi:hypothetical protein